MSYELAKRLQTYSQKISPPQTHVAVGILFTGFLFHKYLFKILV